MKEGRKGWKEGGREEGRDGGREGERKEGMEGGRKKEGHRAIAFVLKLSYPILYVYTQTILKQSILQCST